MAMLKVPCPPGCSNGSTKVGSITMRETNGLDEQQAAGVLRAKGGNAVFLDELVRCAIVEVDGQPVEQPYLDYDKWNSKLRKFSFVVWRKMNDSNEAEVESFFAKAEAK